MAGVTRITALLNGVPTDSIRNLDEIEIESSFISRKRSSETVQPVLTVNELVFVNEAATQIIDYEKGGVDGSTVGILEAMPVDITATDLDNTEIFNFLLDFNTLEQITNQEVFCGIVERDSLNSFSEIAAVTYFDILEIRGVYSAADYIPVKYIVEKLDRRGESANLALAIFILSVQVIQQGKEVVKDIAIASSIAISGFTGLAGAALYAGIVALIDLIIFAKLLIEVVKLVKRLVELHVPPVKRHASMFEFDLLEKALNFLGYKFETGIELMRITVHLPSIPRNGEPIKIGVPKEGQPWDTVGKAIEDLLTKYDGLFAIIGDTIHLRSVNDPFWEKNSTYILANVGDPNIKAINLESERKLTNIKDYKTNRKISYAEDVTDEHTLNEFRGRSALIITEPIDVNNKKYILHKGLDEVNISTSLGSRKDRLNEVEGALFTLLNIADTLNSIFGGGNSSFTGFITERLGALKISQPNFANPKSIVLLPEPTNARVFNIPANHRDLLGALTLNTKFHARKSFVNTEPVMSLSASRTEKNVYIDSAKPNYGNQKLLFNERDVPFDFTDYQKVKNNSYFATLDGTRGKIESSLWKMRKGKSTISYWIKSIWTKNLKETFIEIK